MCGGLRSSANGTFRYADDYASSGMYTPPSITIPVGCLEISPVSDHVAASPAVVRPVNEKSDDVNVSTSASHMSDGSMSAVMPASSIACLSA